MRPVSRSSGFNYGKAGTGKYSSTSENNAEMVVQESFVEVRDKSLRVFLHVFLSWNEQRQSCQAM